jgi:hypothetical protein
LKFLMVQTLQEFQKHLHLHSFHAYYLLYSFKRSLLFILC